MDKVKLMLMRWSEGESVWKYWVYMAIFCARRAPVLWWLEYINILIYSYFISFRLLGISFLPRVSFPMGIFKVRISRLKNSRVASGKGIVIIFEKWRSGGDTSISLGKNSSFIVEKTFCIGDGCKILLEKDACFRVMGKSIRQKSGITCDSIVLCKEKISFGSGTIVSWGCYFSDSSQHSFNGAMKIAPVIIGNHVWISEGVSCGPGCELGDGTVVGAKSLVNKKYPARVFLTGCPAEVRRTGIVWSR